MLTTNQWRPLGQLTPWQPWRLSTAPVYSTKIWWKQSKNTLQVEMKAPMEKMDLLSPIFPQSRFKQRLASSDMTQRPQQPDLIHGSVQCLVT